MLGTIITILIIGVIAVLCERYDKWLKSDNKTLSEKNKS